MKKNTTLYILSGNLSSTPRALKSISTLEDAAFVLVINRTLSWRTLDTEIFSNLNIPFASMNLWRKPFLPWLFATIVHHLFRFIYPIARTSLIINALASEKSSIILIRKLRKLQISVQHVRGHGAGAIYPAWKMAQSLRIPFSIDIEDYHPGESFGRDAKKEKKRREFLLKNILPDAVFVSFASPLIASRTLELTGPLKNHEVLLNSFPLGEFSPPKENTGNLKMIWFSQKITFGRGLELLFPILGRLQGFLWELNLVGEADQKFLDSIPAELRDHINISALKPQVELHRYLSEFDVGLALEVPYSDENKDLCLSNKLLAYAQSGLYILATDTTAQKEFISEDPLRGMICETSESGIAKSLNLIMDSLDTIRDTARERYNTNQGISWEKESRKLLANLPSVPSAD